MKATLCVLHSPLYHVHGPQGGKLGHAALSTDYPRLIMSFVDALAFLLLFFSPA